MLLDFWTFCCVNCLHVLDELRPLEKRYADVLVTIGVHSPKFEHEADPDALAAAVERYEVQHAVLDDPELSTWQAYTARAWPTLVLIDPEGYVAAQYSGEGHAHALAALLDQLVVEYRERGTLRAAQQSGESGRSPLPLIDSAERSGHRADPKVPPSRSDTNLRFPAKAVALPQGGLLVADAGHHSIVQTDAGGETVVRRIGSGSSGLRDGSSEAAAFHEPNGLCLLPSDVAAAVGYDVVVADTVNHALRGVHLGTGAVTTIAGDGRQWRAGDGTTRLSSPWDVTWWQDRVWVAMAGIHQLWTFDPRTGELAVAAGTTHEGLVDGPAGEAWLAQPSGLAADGDRLWIADAEVSAVRWLDADGVHTGVGQGLFDFGFRDGPAGQALLQHPLGVAVLPDGTVAVADTYNDAVRRYDPVTGEVSTLATGLPEVSGLVVTEQGLVAVESAAHRLGPVPITARAVASGLQRTTQRPVLEVAPGRVELAITFVPPPGQRLDDRYGSASSVLVDATPSGLLSEGSGRDTGLARWVRVDGEVGDGVLHVAARAASCDVAEGAGAACRLHQQDWGIPVRVTDGGTDRIELALGGVTGDTAPVGDRG